MAAVRKRIVIGLLILSVIGTAVFLFSQPKEGTLEWHKREYREARNYFFKDPLLARVKRFYWRITSQPPPAPVGNPREDARFNAQVARMESNRVVLVRLGYFAERRFGVTNRSLDQIVSGLWRQPLFSQGGAQITSSSIGPSPGEVAVTACPKDIPGIEAMIRTLDVP